MQRQSRVQHELRHELKHELKQGTLVKVDDIRLDYSETCYLHKQSGRTLNEAEQCVWHWLLQPGS